jgi:8-amino-7-oxononanoate synthase
MYQRYVNTLQALEQKNNLRKLPSGISSHSINLSSNDYLGLNNDIQLRNKFLNDILEKDIRLSAASSRLLTGNSEEYILLEDSMAKAFNREACLIYNSGYHANIGILPALAGKKDLLIADKLVHASIVDGMQLCHSEMKRYNHLDYEHLELILQTHRNNYDKAFIITESIFSMDGDRADLHRLIELKKKYRCFIYLDEAHAFGVYGPNGLGCADNDGCISECDFIVATFGKALASVGAFVVCNQISKQYLVNHSRPLIFTTALPPLNLAWTIFLLERLPSFEEKRKHLQELSLEFSKMLGLPYQSHIIPLITGSNESAIDLSQRLQEAGIHVMPIRYPTVPKEKARLRFSLNADISLSQLQIIPQIIKEYGSTLDN